MRSKSRLTEAGRTSGLQGSGTYGLRYAASSWKSLSRTAGNDSHRQVYQGKLEWPYRCCHKRCTARTAYLPWCFAGILASTYWLAIDCAWRKALPVEETKEEEVVMRAARPLCRETLRTRKLRV
ncbi:hypothetical protein BDZ85DRAFT_93531 [Elsinoe ampelina]|uniref:Uncharacterized protein n=1 Tax=Elsinoe ampelina TaxID=302913 RepID=A0A6A6FY84_9PEZI|nr:hypothetical protein BDZ85DRAFT_93531 [Elsinoe ampelina]